MLLGTGDDDDVEIGGVGEGFAGVLLDGETTSLLEAELPPPPVPPVPPVPPPDPPFPSVIT